MPSRRPPPSDPPPGRGVRAVCLRLHQPPEESSQVGLDQPVAGPGPPPGRAVDGRRRGPLLVDPGEQVQGGGHGGVEDEAVGSQLDGRRRHVGERPRPEPVEGAQPAGQCPGDHSGPTPRRHGGAVPVRVGRNGGGGRPPPHTGDAHHLGRARRADEDRCDPGQAAHVDLDNVGGESGRHPGIHGVAAGLEHAGCHLHGEGVARDRHPPVPDERGT